MKISQSTNMNSFRLNNRRQRLGSPFVWANAVSASSSARVGFRPSASENAEFAGGGASSAHDITFLRESLLPRKLLLLREGKIQVGLIEFDRFWRLIRNGKIISSSQIHITECPRFISLIIDWQNKLPGKVIKIGIASKLLMFLCYIVCCSKKKI